MTVECKNDFTAPVMHGCCRPCAYVHNPRLTAPISSYPILAVLGYFIAALSPNMDVANALLPLYVTIQLMFAGFLIPTDYMRNYWRWAA